MLELFLPFLKPKSATQEDIAYGFKLLGFRDVGESLADRMFKSKKTELEERVLERQLELMGDNPDTTSLNRAVLAAKGAQEVPGFIKSLTSVKKSAPSLTVAEFLRSTENVVDLASFAQQHRAALARRAAKGLSKAI